MPLGPAETRIKREATTLDLLAGNNYTQESYDGLQPQPGPQ